MNASDRRHFTIPQSRACVRRASQLPLHKGAFGCSRTSAFIDVSQKNRKIVPHSVSTSEKKRHLHRGKATRTCALRRGTLPRAKKVSTGHFFTRPSGGPLSSSPVSTPEKKRHPHRGKATPACALRRGTLPRAKNSPPDCFCGSKAAAALSSPMSIP